MPSRAEFVSIVRSVVTDVAEVAEMSPSAVEDLQVAVSEACANVVRHAYPEGISDEDAQLLVRCSADGGKVTAEVIDRGRGFDRSRPRRDPDGNGGLGLILIGSLMDQFQLWSSPGSGTRVRMVKFAER